MTTNTQNYSLVRPQTTRGESTLEIKGGSIQVVFAKSRPASDFVGITYNAGTPKITVPTGYQLWIKANSAAVSISDGVYTEPPPPPPPPPPPQTFLFRVNKAYVQNITTGAYTMPINSGNSKITEGSTSTTPLEQIELELTETKTLNLITNYIASAAGEKKTSASYLIRFTISVDAVGDLTIGTSSRTAGDLRYYSNAVVYPISGYSYEQVSNTADWGGVREGTIEVSTDLFVPE